MKPSAHLPAVLCIDLGPDDRAPSAPDTSLPGVEAAFQRMDTFRRSLIDSTSPPLRFAWFLRLDSQIEEIWGRRDWLPIGYSSELQRVRSKGGEIGLHVHFSRRDKERRIMDTSDPLSVENELRSACNRFESIFNNPWPQDSISSDQG